MADLQLCGRMLIPCISIRQPWAWLILHGGKDIENRTWPLPSKFNGKRVGIHAGKWFNPGEIAQIFNNLKNARLIPKGKTLTLHELQAQCGGIVGIATFFSGPANESPWAFPGEHHWHVTDARPLPFHPCKGRLGIFEVSYPYPIPEAV